jgi:hypothetical protein
MGGRLEHAWVVGAHSPFSLPLLVGAPPDGRGPKSQTTMTSSQHVAICGAYTFAGLVVVGSWTRRAMTPSVCLSPGSS